MKKLFLILIITLPLSISSIWGQKESRFTFSVSSDTVGMNGALEVTFTLENAQTKQFNPPDFNGFDVQGPSSASSMSIINGDMSQKMSYTFYLTPKAQGTYTIGKATVESEGKKLETEEKSIVVVEHFDVPKRRPQNRNPFFNEDDDDRVPRTLPRQPTAPQPPRTEDKKKKYSTEKI